MGSSHRVTELHVDKHTVTRPNYALGDRSKEALPQAFEQATRDLCASISTLYTEVQTHSPDGGGPSGLEVELREGRHRGVEKRFNCKKK